VIETFLLNPKKLCDRFLAGRAYYISGSSVVLLMKQFLEWFAMPDERRAHAPTPHLRTRPATMLTAIGLCVVIVAMQLVPDIRDVTSSRVTAPVVASTR
jgi:hypothetical protein